MRINKTDYALLHRALELAEADYHIRSQDHKQGLIVRALYAQRAERALELREELDGKATKNSKRVASTPAQDKSRSRT
jgi:hypothetical protein